MVTCNFGYELCICMRACVGYRRCLLRFLNMYVCVCMCMYMYVHVWVYMYITHTYTIATCIWYLYSVPKCQ